MTIVNHDVFMSDSLSDLISYEKNEDKKMGQFQAMIEFHGQKMIFDIFEFENPIIENNAFKKTLGIIVPAKLMYIISSMYDFDHKLQFDIGQGAINKYYTQTYRTSRILKAKKNENATWNVMIEFGALHE